MSASSHNCPPEKHKYVLTAAILAGAMGFIDLFVVAVALPQIRVALGAGFIEAQWISLSYLLFFPVLALLSGALGDRVGVKRVFGYGVGLFVFASLLCAVAPNLASLVAFRALQGVGAAVMIAGSMSLIAVNIPRSERGRVMGIWVLSVSIAVAFGGLFSGLLLTYLGADAWRWIFAINLLVGALVLGVLFGFVPTDSPKAKVGLGTFDWWGVVLITGSLGLLAGGMTFVQESWAVWALLLGLAFGWLAVVWEMRLKKKGKRPLVELSLFGSRAFSSANLLGFLLWSGIGATVFFLSSLIIVAWKLPPSFAGGMFLPFGLAFGVVSLFTGGLIDRLGVRSIIMLGSFVVVAAFLMLGWAVVRQDYWFGILPSLFVFGCGFGLVVPTSSAVIVTSVEGRYFGAASGINNMGAGVAGLFAVAGLGTFVSYVYGTIVRGGDLHPDIAEMMAEAGFGERLSGGLYQIATVELQSVAMNHAMIALLLVLALLALISGIVGWFTQD